MSRAKRVSQTDKLAQAMNDRQKSMTAYLSEEPQEGEVIVDLDCTDIDRNPRNHRTKFDQEKIHALALSIKENGQGQPIVVRRLGSRYEIVFGEHRWRACSLLPNKSVKAVVREMSDVDAGYLCYEENDKHEKPSDYEQWLGINTLLELGEPKERIIERTGLKYQDFQKLRNYTMLPERVCEFLRENQRCLQRNEIQEVATIVRKCGWGQDVPDEFYDYLLDLMRLYSDGKLPRRSDITRQLKNKFVQKHTRNREKVNKETELFIGQSAVGKRVDTSTEIRYTFNKQELPQDKFEELNVLISNFLASQ